MKNAHEFLKLSGGALVIGLHERGMAADLSQAGQQRKKMHPVGVRSFFKESIRFLLHVLQRFFVYVRLSR